MSDNITLQENFVLKISNKVLLKWRELKEIVQNITYLDLLALSAVKLPISMKPDADRVEESQEH